MNVFFALVVLLAAACAPAAAHAPSVAWERDLKSAQNKAMAEAKPLLVLITNDDCPACDALRDALSAPTADAEVNRMAESFVMTMLNEAHVDAETSRKLEHDVAFGPDGHYFPRIVFIDAEGNARPDIINELHNYDTHKFYYATAQHVTYGMEQALKHMDPFYHEDM